MTNTAPWFVSPAWTVRPCSHVWIDPAEVPIARAPYSPVIGPGRREMQPGRRYRCQRCGQTLDVPLPE